MAPRSHDGSLDNSGAKIEASIDDSKKELTLEDAYGQYYNSYKTLWGLVGAPIRWRLTVTVFFLHAVALVALFTFPYLQNWKTTLWSIFIGIATVWGLFAGGHRYWSHKSFKATTPMRILMGFCYSLSGQYTLYSWANMHRAHHKFSDTTADPYDTTRGITFTQIGFVCLEKHPECKKKLKLLDASDLLNDPVVKFTKDHYWPVTILCFCAFPISIPMLFWGETFYWSFLINSLRFVICFAIVGMATSVNHRVGTRPYNSKHQSTEVPWFSWFSLGEGFHNYHHVFPYDYKTEEFGANFLNFTTFVLDLFAAIGWVYDRKSVPSELVKRAAIRNGDGSHRIYGKLNDNLGECDSKIMPAEYDLDNVKCDYY